MYPNMKFPYMNIRNAKIWGTISANFSQDTFPCCHVAEKNRVYALLFNGYAYG